MAVESPNDLTKDPKGTFEAQWEEHGIPATWTVQGTTKGVTPVYNRGKFLERLEADREELDGHGMDDAPVYRGMARRAFAAAASADDSERVDRDVFEEMEQRNVIDSNVAERSTPLVFDPEILSLLKDAAPLAMGRWARQGQEGYEVVFNRIDRRETPIGRVPESVARRLQDYARDFGLNRETVPMKIFADTMEIGGFAAAASSHYMNLADIAETARMAEYAQFDEQEMFYGRFKLDSRNDSVGDPGEFDYVEGSGPKSALEGGSPVGSYAARGLAEWCRLADDAATNVSELPDTNHYVSKTGVSSNFAQDIKAEITELLQGPYATRAQDLEIWTSETMVDVLENTFVGRARHDTNQDTIQFGGEEISIKGDIGIYGSHNVDSHTYVAQDEDGDIRDPWEPYQTGDADYDDRTVGSESDVFIVNTATWRKRELSPLSSIPLARRGDHEEVGLVAYDGNAELSGGFFAKYLEDYDISGYPP
jgi:hypothetical protein